MDPDVKEIFEKQDKYNENLEKVLHGDGMSVDGVCPTIRKHSEEIKTINTDLKDDIKPACKDYRDNKNKILGGIKVFVIVGTALTLINGASVFIKHKSNKQVADQQKIIIEKLNGDNNE